MSVQKLGPDYFNVVVSRQVDGKQVRVGHRFHGTRRAAELLEAKMKLNAEEASEQRDDNTKTFGEYLEKDWIPFAFARVAKDGSPKTAISIKSRLRLHVLPYAVAKVRMCDLNARKLDTWMTQLRQARPDLSERTLEHVFTVVRAACRQAVKWDLLDKDPTASMGDRPDPRSYAPHHLTAEETNMLAAAFSDDPLGVAYAIVLGVGLRPGEVCALRWQDFNLGGHTVMPHSGMVPLSAELGGGLQECQVKTDGSVREVSIPDWVMEILTAHRRRRMEDRLMFGKPEALIVSNRNGGPLHPTYLSKKFQELRTSLGLAKFRLYDLRHGNARALVDAGVDLDTVAKRLGHRRLTTTQQYLKGRSAPLDQAAAQALDNIILPRREAQA